MRRPIRALTLVAATTAGIGTATLAGSGLAAGSPSSAGTRVALRANLRHCDFSPTAFAPVVPQAPLGTGTAVVHQAGSTVAVEVNLVNAALPGMHYDVGLIQAPRSAAAPCGPGDPNTVFAGMDLDAAGRGAVTIGDAVRSGTTAVWVIVERPSDHSQNPAEVYTSEFLVPV
ncbi:hypothetical protein MB901379_04798 [Mycobacterium basiliense]|uniref:Uncharacterized protein n=1 Tax=Mycobacterium basiliense TaxID=2094119 RepID=A0A3S4DWW2_9MYCO|nr:hypothetical protein [Mycobacterium basiliense]VDM91181.1 hypothetical protein MB901379_04798 [Mycobacterium basiliense]